MSLLFCTCSFKYELYLYIYFSKGLWGWRFFKYRGIVPPCGHARNYIVRLMTGMSDQDVSVSVSLYCVSMNFALMRHIPQSNTHEWRNVSHVCQKLLCSLNGAKTRPAAFSWSSTLQTCLPLNLIYVLFFLSYNGSLSVFGGIRDNRQFDHKWWTETR